MADRNHYELLGVSTSATQEEIRAAYRAAARQIHPDTGGSAADMRNLNEAWNTLRDPARRAIYDRTLSGETHARPTPAAAPPEPDDPWGLGAEWTDYADDLLDDTPFGPTHAPQGWWAIAPPAMLVVAIALSLGAVVFGSPALFVFAGAAFLITFGLFVLAPLSAMTKARKTQR